MDCFNFPDFEHLNLLEKHRIESYKSWPYDDSSKCNIQKMAEAGFYWSGNKTENDTATCFACGKVLHGWEATDDPWTEHVKHAPQCVFAKLRKPEKLLTIEEFLDLFQIIAKNKIYKKQQDVLQKYQADIAKKREAFIKSHEK